MATGIGPKFARNIMSWKVQRQDSEADDVDVRYRYLTVSAIEF